MTLLDSTLAVWDWIKVPSHVDIPGNERVDKLAEQGKVSSPLYLTLRHPLKPPRTPLASPPPQGGDSPACEPQSALLHSIECRSACEIDFVTPLLLRDRQDVDEGVPVLSTLERRLFVREESGGLDKSTVAMEDSVLSGVSTIESPRSDQLSDLLVDESTDEDEFSTDVSSTRNRRRR